MWNIKNIMQIGVCSFYKNIYEFESLKETEFEEFIDVFLEENSLENCLKRSDVKKIYDIENIKNIYESNKKRNKKYKENEVKAICKEAYRKTIEKDKTINVEAFVENLIKEF